MSSKAETADLEQRREGQQGTAARCQSSTERQQRSADSLASHPPTLRTHVQTAVNCEGKAPACRKEQAQTATREKKTGASTFSPRAERRCSTCSPLAAYWCIASSESDWRPRELEAAWKAASRPCLRSRKSSMCCCRGDLNHSSGAIPSCACATRQCTSAGQSNVPHASAA